MRKHPEYPHNTTSFTIQSSSRANKTKHYCRNFRYITFIYTKKNIYKVTATVALKMHERKGQGDAGRFELVLS